MDEDIIHMCAKLGEIMGVKFKYTNSLRRPGKAHYFIMPRRRWGRRIEYERERNGDCVDWKYK